MIPVEVTLTPWHFRTWLDLLDHWQTVIAGFAAAVNLGPFHRAFYDLVCTVGSRLEKDGLEASGIGDLETLEFTLEAERIAARSFAASVALVGAWSRKLG